MADEERIRKLERGIGQGLFAYGTLEVRCVMRGVSGGDPPGRPARLEGYVRFLLKGLPYPGIVPRRDSSVDGVLYSGLDTSMLARIDAFEDECYERRDVAVLVDGRARRAWTYVVPDPLGGLPSDRPWSRDFFEEHVLPDLWPGF